MGQNVSNVIKNISRGKCRTTQKTVGGEGYPRRKCPLFVAINYFTLLFNNK